MLTKKDLQQIGTVIDERLDKKLDEKLDSKLDEKLKPIKTSLKKIEKKLDVTIKVFDRDFNYHHRRLVQLEEKVGLKPPPFFVKTN